MPSMETAKRIVHHNALPVGKTLTVRAPRLLRVTVGTASNRMLISSMLTTDGGYGYGGVYAVNEILLNRIQRVMTSVYVFILHTRHATYLQ